MQLRMLFTVILTACCLLSVKAQKQDSTQLFQKTDLLFTAIKMPEVYADAINATVDNQIKATPSLANYKEDLRSFLQKSIGWTALKTDIARLYMKYYTAEDLDAMTKFYQTPAGQKMALASAPLVKEMQDLQQSTVQAHAAELNQLMAGKVNGKN